MIGIEAFLHGGEKKTDRVVSPEGRRKLNHPLAFTKYRNRGRWKKL